MTDDASRQTVIDRRVLSYYGQAFDEAARLVERSVAGMVELERTKRLIGSRLSDASRIYDVGGATGVHARWLTEAGHRVTILDVVPEHIEHAQEQGFDAVVGDARHLPFETHSADATLVLGPLYHLVSRDDRVRCLREAIRVTQPGGVVAAAGITRSSAHAAIHAISPRIAEMPDASAIRPLPDDPAHLVYGENVVRFLETGVVPHLPFGFPLAYGHTCAALRHEFHLAGLDDVVVYGVEGPSGFALESLPGHHPNASDVVDQAVALAHAVDHCEVPDAVRDLSPHLLAFARVS